jgi:exosome complex RNA-binding protein Csl4
MMTKVLSFVLLTTTLLYLNCSPSKKDMVMKYFNAVNKHEPGTELLLLSDNITYSVIESFTLRGKDELRNLAEYDSTIHSELVYSNLTEAGDTVICQVTEKNDRLAALDITSVAYDYVKFVVRHKHIWDIIMKMNDKSINEISSKTEPLIDWASNNKADVLNDIMPGGEFIYNKVTAEMWLQLLQKYNESRGEE